MQDASRVMLENADSDGYMLGVLAVPSWMTPSDFLAFVAPAQEGMAHLRMIRCVSCIKCLQSFYESAIFTQGYGPEPVYSSHQVSQGRKCLGICRSLQWQSVQFDECRSFLACASRRYHRSFSPHRQPATCHVVHITSVSIDADDSVPLALSRLGSAKAPVFELPTCPVCLERMDSAVTGLVTVPCSHTFHCECLSKWGDSR